MQKVNPRAFEFAMASVKDGFIFERFTQDLLSQVLGDKFVPVGGNKDHGIDGLEHCFQPEGIDSTIYQMSIELDAESKVRRTIEALKKNRIEFLRLIYVTNRSISNEYSIVERIFKEYRVNLVIHDIAWLRGVVTTSEGSVRIYLTFVDIFCHQFVSTPLVLDVSDLVSDPRVFIYLRQQWEDRNEKTRLDELLADALILIGLEGTDPDKGILRSESELLDRVRNNILFSLDLLQPIIHVRLDFLSRKPTKRINHHTKEDKYCIPYQTRLDVQQKQLADAALHESFLKSTGEKLEARLAPAGIRIRDAALLLNRVLNKLFKQEGIEFANSLRDTKSTAAIEKSLPDIISTAVDESHVEATNRTSVKQALLGTVREIIYMGTPDEAEYLQRLSSTYMMLFLLQCDPKLAVFFSTMAGRLRLFVDNSLLVPAMSELPLDTQHRRHWNLLKKAQATGIKMYIDRPHLAELAAHIRISIEKYQEICAGREDFFDDETKIMYVDEILIRSYLYSRLHGETEKFEQFINKFVTPGAPDDERQLLVWLKSSFGIELFSEKAAGIEVKPDEVQRVAEELSKIKHTGPASARNDVYTVLAVFALRLQDKEEESAFGFYTWWLSKDTTSQRAVQLALGKKYAINIYMRTDFLNSYIALSPNSEQVNRAFDRMFPTLVGVSISQHVPPEICQKVQQLIQEHATHDPARVSAIIASLADKLKGEPAPGKTQKLSHYLDEEFDKLRKELRKRG